MELRWSSAFTIRKCPVRIQRVLQGISQNITSIRPPRYPLIPFHFVRHNSAIRRCISASEAGLPTALRNKPQEKLLGGPQGWRIITVTRSNSDVRVFSKTKSFGHSMELFGQGMGPFLYTDISVPEEALWREEYCHCLCSLQLTLTVVCTQESWPSLLRDNKPIYST